MSSSEPAISWSAWAVETINTGSTEVHLLVGAEAGVGERRSGVMVNLLVDRSGSMKGAPLGAAVEAARQLVDLASPDDFIGLLLFDGVAEQRVPVMAMDDKGKRMMEEALSEVHTGRGTALHHAVDLGARALQRVFVPGRRPRLLLLTDGEPSVGPESQDEFDGLAQKLAQDGVAIHAIGLARHYVAEILSSLTLPSGNAFEHVDGPEGLSEAMGTAFSRLFGEVATEAKIRVSPAGFTALTCRHAYSTHAENDGLSVLLGDLSRGLSRRVLFSGSAGLGWSAKLEATWLENQAQRSHPFEIERVDAEADRGRLILALGAELELVQEETAAWLSLARRDLDRAEAQLEVAEAKLGHIETLKVDLLSTKRHAERLSDLRLAVERGEGDIPLLIRRAQSANAGTNVSQVIPIQAYRQRR